MIKHLHLLVSSLTLLIVLLVFQNIQVTPMAACLRADRTDENIELSVDGKTVFVVGDGAETVLDWIGE